MTTGSRSAAHRALEKLAGRPLTFGDLLGSIGEGEGWSRAELAERLGVSRSHLCDIVKGRKTVTPARAARFAHALGYGEAQFVRLAVQDMIAEAGLAFRVELRPA